MQPLQTRHSLGAEPLPHYPRHSGQCPQGISHSLLQAPEAGAAFTALSAALQEHSGSCLWSRSCLKCRALHKSWESTEPSLPCAAKRGSLLSSRLPTAATRPSCLHYELPTFCLHCQVAELKLNLNWGRLKNNPKLSQENPHIQKSHSRSERHARHLINWICSKPALKRNFDIIKFNSSFVRNCCELQYFSGILKIFYLRRVFVFLNCKTATKTIK